MGSMVKEITKKYLFRLENINLFKFIQLLISLVPLKIMTSSDCLGEFVDHNNICWHHFDQELSLFPIYHHEILQDDRIENPALSLTLSIPSGIKPCTYYKEISKALN